MKKPSLETGSETIENAFDADLRAAAAPEKSTRTALCYPEPVLRRLARREFSPEKIEIMMRHIVACDFCRRIYREAELVWRMMSQNRGMEISVPSPARRRPLFAAPLAVGVGAGMLTALLVFLPMRFLMRRSQVASDAHYQQELARQRQQFATRERALQEQLATLHGNDSKEITRLQRAYADQQKQIHAARTELAAAKLANSDRVLASLHQERQQASGLHQSSPDLAGQNLSAPYHDEHQKLEIACLTGQASLPAAEGDAYALRGVSAATAETPILLKDPAPVMDVHPVLECLPAAGAAHYRVTLFDPERPGTPVPGVVALTPTAWKITGGLERGRTYRWQVTAERQGKPIQSLALSFTVLSAPEAKRVAYMRRYYADAPLKLGLFYAQHGFAAAAESTWSKIPEHPLVARWLKSLQNSQAH